MSVAEQLNIVDPLMKIANMILTIQAKPLLKNYPDVKKALYDTDTKYPLFYVVQTCAVYYYHLDFYLRQAGFVFQPTVTGKISYSHELLRKYLSDVS